MVDLVIEIIAIYCRNLPLTHLISESGMDLLGWFHQQGYAVDPDASNGKLSEYIHTIQSGWIPWELFLIPEKIWSSGTTNILATIPSEIIKIILQNLSIDDTISLARTSHYFDRLCQDPEIWKAHVREWPEWQRWRVLKLGYRPLTEVALECLDVLDSDQLSEQLEDFLEIVASERYSEKPPRSLIRLPLLVILKIASLNKRVDFRDGGRSDYMYDLTEVYKPEDTDELFRGIISISLYPENFLVELVTRLWYHQKGSEISYWLDSIALKTPDLLEEALIGFLSRVYEDLYECHSKLFTALWRRYGRCLSRRQRKRFREYDPVEWDKWEGGEKSRNEYLDNMLKNYSP